MIELRDTYSGKLCDISQIDPDKVVVLRALVPTRSLSKSRTVEILRGFYATGMDTNTKVLVVGCDVGIGEVSREELTEAILDGTVDDGDIHSLGQ